MTVSASPSIFIWENPAVNAKVRSCNRAKVSTARGDHVPTKGIAKAPRSYLLWSWKTSHKPLLPCLLSIAPPKFNLRPDEGGD